MLTTQSIFDRYQEVRARFPQVYRPRATRLKSGPCWTSHDQVDAFVFDAFGVLNVGETMIPGADHTAGPVARTWLRHSHSNQCRQL